MTVANVNVTKVLLKRGNTAQNNNYTGVNGELTIDTQAATLRIHDGSTQGGTVINAGGVAGAYSNTNTAAYLESQSITSANIGAFQVYANANAASQTTEIDLLRANITAANTAITGLQSNAAIQAELLDTLTGNAATQSQVLDTLTSNAAVQSDTLTTLLSNAVAQQTSLIDLVANAAAQAQAIANVTGTYSNTNVAAYLSAFDGNILPAANVTYSLGDATHQWKDLWVSNNTIYIGNTPVRVHNGTLLVNDTAIADNVTKLTNGASTFQLFANGESRSSNAIFAANGVTIIDANGAIQGGMYNSGDADWFNIGADAGRGFKFYVNTEDPGPLFFANGSVNVPGGLYSDFGVIGDVNMYGGVISGANPNWNYLTLTNQVEGYAYVQLPNNTTANVANLRIYNDAGNVEIGTGDGNFSYNSYFTNYGELKLANGLWFDVMGAINATAGTATFQSTEYDVQISANSSGNSKTWQFNTDGNLTVPDGTITSGANTFVPTDTDFAIRLNHSTFGEANVIVNSQGFMEVTGGYVGRSFTQILPGEVGATGYFGFTGNITNISGINGLILDTGLEGSGGTWTFDTNGDLTVPGNILFPGGSTYSNNTFVSPTSNGALNKYEWKFSDQSIGNDTITLQWNLLDTTLSQWYLSTNSQTKYLVFDGESQSLGFVGDSGGSGTVTFGATTNNGTGGINDIELTSATGNAFVRTGSNSWKFNQSGNLIFPDSTVQPTAFFGYSVPTTFNDNVSVNGNIITTNGIYWSNGAAYSTGGAGSYGNVEVAQYLSNFDGTINFTASPAIITGLGNITTASAFVSSTLIAGNILTTSGVFWSNGTNLLSSLASQSYVDTQITNLVNNAPALLDTLGEIAANLATEANAVGSVLNSLTNTNANITAANVNIANLESNAASQQTSIDTLLGRVDQAVNMTSSPQFAGLTTTANVELTGNVHIHQNLVVDGNINFIGNVTQTNITTANAVFTGDTYGFGALYAGVLGYTPLPYTVIQATADYNDYSQINFQNLNLSANASTEWVATAGNGTDLTNYIDFGIAGGAWNGTQLNSVGTAAKANDGWVYVLGNTAAGTGGNLVLGTIQPGKRVNILTGGPGNGNIYSYFNSSGLTTANVYATNYLYANGVSILTGIGGTYSNTNVAGYLAGNITTGNIQVGTIMRINGTTQTIDTANGSSITIGSRINLTGSAAGLSMSVTHPAQFASSLTVGTNSNAQSFYGTNYFYTNGVSILSGIGGTYSNTNVAAYLTSYTGNIAANHVIASNTISAVSITTSGTGGNITGANVISANTFVFAANGVNILTAASGSGTDDVLRANVGAYQIFANANAATQATSINTINANLGAYQTFANANVSSIQNQIFASNANIGAFQTYANATFGVSSYGNTQVAAYLLTYPNVNVSTLNTTSANITTLRAANFNSANAVISGGYISALTNASIIAGTITTVNSTNGNITTLVSTNLSTANAVVTGGYASGLANISVTGNATVGNLVGTSPNTTIIAGAYSSTFDNVGNVVLPNVFVSGNTTAMGIAAGYAPNRPAFRIYGGTPAWWTTANTNFKGASIVVDYNQGSYFNSTTGVFTAPVAGLYHTTLNARIGSVNAQGQIMVIKNGQTSGGNVAVMWESDTNTGTAVHFGVTSVIKLAVGDILTANITAGNIQFDVNDSWTVTYIG